MPDFSIVCCVSRPDVFESCLLASINTNRGMHDIEVIPVINNDNRYSASVALNAGLAVSRSDIVIFAHQDVRLLDNWFDRLAAVVADVPDDWSIIGAAGIALRYGRRDIGRWGGAVTEDTVAIGSVWDSDATLDQLPYWNGDKSLTMAHCADECVLVLNKCTGIHFDTDYRGFHFYGVDICLQARAAGYKVYCANLPIVHYGKYSASIAEDLHYWTYFRLLHNKWYIQFEEMLGTHMHWSRHELTSYIPIRITSHDGMSVRLMATGLVRAELHSDKAHGLIH